MAAQTASAAVIDADGAERAPDADGVGDGAEHGAEDGAEDGGAERGPEQLAAALPGSRDGEPGERACPRGGARDALDEPRDPERPGPVREREREARCSQQGEPGDDGDLRPSARGGEPAGDPAEQRPGAEGSDEQPGAGLGEPELLRVAGHERREDAEQQRVDEQDHRHENEKPAHQPTLPVQVATSRRTEPESPVQTRL